MNTVELDTVLATPLGEFAGALDNLRWAVDQARPEEPDGHALVDHFQAVADDLFALLQELSVAAGAAQSGDARQQRRALVSAQRTYARMLRRVFDDLAGFAQFAALDELAREQPTTWGVWSMGVMDALEPIPPGMALLAEALAERWERQPDPSGTLSLTAQAFSAGGQAGGRVD